MNKNKIKVLFTIVFSLFIFQSLITPSAYSAKGGGIACGTHAPGACPPGCPSKLPTNKAEESDQKNIPIRKLVCEPRYQTQGNEIYVKLAGEPFEVDFSNGIGNRVSTSTVTSNVYSSKDFDGRVDVKVSITRQENVAPIYQSPRIDIDIRHVRGNSAVAQSSVRSSLTNGYIESILKSGYGDLDSFRMECEMIVE